MHKLIASLLGILILANVAGCTTQTNTTQQNVETVKIGVILPMSGPATNYGQDALNAYTYIINKFNTSQSDLHIELIVEDGKCEGKDATTAIQKLITVDGVQVIIGGFCSAETIAAGQIAQTYHIPMLSPVSSSPEISNIGAYVFKFYNDRYTTKVLAEYLETLGITKVIAVTEQSEACIRYVDAFSSSFSGTIVSYKFASNEKDFTMLAKQIKSTITPSDFMLFLGCNDVSTIGGLKAFEKEGILEMMKGNIAGNETIASIQNYQELGTALNGIKTTQLKNLSSFPENGKTLAETFKETFVITSDVLRMILGAEAMDLTIEAIQKAGNNAEAIKDYFTSLSAEYPKSGYFGNYYFSEERNAEGLGFLVYELQNGQLVAVQ